MMIALSSPALSLLSVDKALEIVARGFKAWEIVGEGRHFLPSIMSDLESGLPSYDLECSVHAPLSDVNIGSLNPRMREVAMRELLETIECTGALGLGPLTVHPGFYTPLGQLDKEGARHKTREALKVIEGAAQEHGVTVAVENMPAMPISMATTPSALLDLLEGTELGICFDIGHANTTHNIEDYLPLLPRFRNIHVHDNHGEFDQHLVIGEGNVPFSHILPKLKGYGGRFVIEARHVDSATTSRDRLQDLLGRAHCF
jgi:sugar phosphate isomerase/epimerase